MTAEQFIWWLRGYLDSIGEVQTLPKADVKALRDALNLVGPVRAPAPTPTAPHPSVFDKMATNRCLRCGQLNFGGHLCDGVLTNV